MYTKVLSLLLLISFLAACATKPLPVGVGTEVSAQFAPPTKGETIVILPTISVFREFEVGEEPVATMLNQELISAGYKTYLYPKSDLMKFWETETALSGKQISPQAGQNNLESKVRLNAKLAVKLAKDFPNALMLSPVIVLRQADLRGDFVQWDGRKSRPPTLSKMHSDENLGGSIEAISLELIALDVNGNQQFKTFGGLLLPYRMNVVAAKMEERDDLFEKQPQYGGGLRLRYKPDVVSAKAEMREDIFQKASEYADGVKIALSPLLTGTKK